MCYTIETCSKSDKKWADIRQNLTVRDAGNWVKLKELGAVNTLLLPYL